MFEQLGHLVFKHRRAVILTWLLIIVLSAIAAPRVGSKLAPGAVAPTRGEAAEGYNILEQQLGIRTNTFVVVFTSETLRANDTVFQNEMDAALAGLQSIQALDPPITYQSTGDPQLISRDGYTTYATVGVNGDASKACSLLADVRERLKPQPDLTMVVTGDAAYTVDAETAAMDTMKKSEIYTFPLIAIVLVWVFGGLVAAGLPLAIGGASMALTMGLVFLLSGFVEITSTSLAIIAFLGLGVGVDYSLMMVSRFREELGRGKSVEQSLVTTSATSGKAIFYSAGTCIIGLAAVISFDNPVARSLGIGGVTVVLLALVAGLSLLPALLAVLGTKVNRLTLFRLAKQNGTFWERLARWEMRHPVVVLLIVLPVLCLFIWPLARINPSNISYTALPPSTQARQGYEELTEGFGAGELAPIMVVATANSTITDPDNVSSLYDLTRRIALEKDVSSIDSIVNFEPSITKEQYQLMYASPDSIPDPGLKVALNHLVSDHATLIQVYTSSDPMGQDARALVTSIRNMNSTGLKIYVTGATALDVDMVNQLFHHFLWVLLFIVVASYLALFWLFKSVLLPLKAILLNIASVAATYGILVFIFQRGHLSGVLDFTADGTINMLALVLVFGVVFGLSMDYEVFLLSRVKEVWGETRDNTTSVAVGLARTARIITSAALIMVVVFGTFAIGDLILLKLTGLGLAISILLDATVIRLFLAPAIMRLLGKWNWWAPAFLQRL